MNPSVLVPAISVGLFLGMLACLELGDRIGRRAEGDGSGHEGLGAIDLLPPSDQPELRRPFRNYLEARFRAYERSEDQERVDRFIAQAAQLQQEIWTRAVAAGHVDQTQNTTRVALPAINEMIDVTTARSVAARTRLPGPVIALLFVVALFSALTAGYAMAKRKRRSVLHLLLYAAAAAITVYVVLALDNPRYGLIRLDATDKILHDLHDSIRQ